MGVEQGALVVLVTASSQEEALLIGRGAVQKKLAACVTVVPNVTSIFEWEGTVSEEREWLLVMKSHADVYDALESEVKALHSYEVPEVIALSVTKGSSEYLAWVKAMTHVPD
ncbi:MAG: divalent-cation tolerance protein CutA [Nitrospira sp. SB0666_bin_27]|nr:divalent-cation tolerance protein CutA [Nitrospira sp. SB0666_bin_27]MYF25344.1 divalent-cation tolerance protein CutA [Nitrospira sp. SB0678_bin_10]